MQIIQKINAKFNRIYPSSAQLGQNERLDNVNTKVSQMERRRLVPVMTMYMPYTYGVSAGVINYYPLR